MKTKASGATKLFRHSRVYSSKGLFHPLRSLADIYLKVFCRHRSRLIQLHIQNTTRGAKLQVVFDIIINLRVKKGGE